MVSFEALSCNQVWKQAAAAVRDNGLMQESRTYKSAVTTETLELVHASMTVANPRDRIVFARPINPAFAIAEVIWILAGSNDVGFVRFWNETMKNFSDDGITLHGAYGHRLGSGNSGDFWPELVTVKEPVAYYARNMQLDQLRAAYNALSIVPHSRQVVLQIWDYKRDFPYNGGAARSKDIPCNVLAHLLVRDGKLHWLQIMRSNDLMWGTPYNFIQWTTLQEIMAGWLGLQLGQYTHVASSLHVYEDHWDELKRLELGAYYVDGDAPKGTTKLMFKQPDPDNLSDLRIQGYTPWARVFEYVVSAALELTRITHIREVFQLNEDFHEAIGLPEWFTYHDKSTSGAGAYCQWMALLSAETCRKLGNVDEALHFIQFAGPYYQASWMQWLERKKAEADAKRNI